MLKAWLEKTREKNLQSGAGKWRHAGYASLAAAALFYALPLGEMSLFLGGLFIGAGIQSLLAAQHIRFWQEKSH